MCLIEPFELTADHVVSGKQNPMVKKSGQKRSLSHHSTEIESPNVTSEAINRYAPIGGCH
jgi:hypothetical protein